MGNFLRGLTDPFRGLTFLVSRPRLWPWVVLPFLLSLAFYVLVIGLGWHFFGDWISHSFLDEESWWWRTLGYLINVIFWIAILLLAAIAFIPVASLIANPFNELLSERTERLYLGRDPDSASVGFFRALYTGISGELSRAVTVSFLLLIAWSLNLIPVIGSIVSVTATTYITARFLSLEYTSFSMDRRVYTWPQKKAFLQAHKARTLGFGTMAFLILTVPFVNAIFIPISAVAGTLLFCDTAIDAKKRIG